MLCTPRDVAVLIATHAYTARILGRLEVHQSSITLVSHTLKTRHKPDLFV